MIKTIFGASERLFPLYFGLVNGPKVTIQRKHFPVEFRAHPYIFGISTTRRMGAACKQLQNPTFIFLPILVMRCIIGIIMSAELKMSPELGV